MIKGFLILLGCLLSFGLHAEEPVGFLWYNVKEGLQEKTVNNKKPGMSFNSLSFTDRDAVLHFYTMEALHKARNTKSVSDMKVFLSLQNYWLNESSRFASLFQKTMLLYPEYDYTVTHPTSNLGTKMVDSFRELKRKEVIHELAKQHGLLFFYRGSNPYDQRQIPIVRDFCNRFHFPLIPVSVDGIHAHELADSRFNHGQAEALGVKVFPALLLVNPKTHTIRPVAFGFTTQDVIERRLVFTASAF
ncbi:type-F conjugative transfer system pilin assembly protein TraF [Legionella sp.]|uniref:type-F conjugative transfer system pilin assembly protein TraF n=1 Tax=Legionella sp. TaxID=459 RepID=UPI00321FB080